MKRIWPIALVWLMAQPALAEVAGPPAPPPAKLTPAQQAIALYHEEHDPAPPTKPCRPGGHDEITVCAQSDRLPLPGESGPRAGPRTATGEMPSTAGGVGGSPMLQGKGTGLTLTVKTSGAKVSGNSDN